MDIKQNPFVSDIFSTIWLNKFNKHDAFFTFDFIEDLRFYKASKFPIFINVGRNHTKGVSYTIKNVEIKNFENSTILIYDIPGYFNIETSELPDHIKIHKIKQYPGYLTNLKKYISLQDYLQKTLSKGSRSKLNKYSKRLELCFDITYKTFYGEISKEDYEIVFKKFKVLLEKRFTDKQITNNNLQADEWNFYYQVAFPMILDKKANLFVVYNGTDPISITLNYLGDNILFHGITVFDIDFSKFNVGKIALLNLFSWCFENNIQTFDFSKGHFNWKTHWMDKSYTFEYHVIYDSTSFISKILARWLKYFFTLKQYLREKELNTKLHRFTYWINNRGITYNEISKYNFFNTRKNISESELKEISLISNDYAYLKPLVNEFLFLNKEAFKHLRIWKVINEESTYLLKGKEISKLLTLH